MRAPVFFQIEFGEMHREAEEKATWHLYPAGKHPHLEKDSTDITHVEPVINL